MGGFEIQQEDGRYWIIVDSGYDPENSYSLNHDNNWWLTVVMDAEGFTLDVQIGRHDVILMDVVAEYNYEDVSLEVKVKEAYKAKVLARALGYVKNAESRILKAMDALAKVYPS